MSSPNRPPPLIVLAATALVVVVGVGVVSLVGGSSPPPDETEPAEPSLTATPDPPAPAPPGPAEPAAPPAATVAPVELPEGDPDADPVWARRPKQPFATSYPPGGAYNPPLPPVKLLPQMLEPGTPLPDGSALEAPGTRAGAPPSFDPYASP